MISQWILAAAADPSPWTQLGLGALVAAPISSFSWVLWRELRKERDKSDLLQLARVQDSKEAVVRERELADRLGPLLAEAAKVLSTAPDKFEQAINQAQTSTRNTEVNDMLRRLEQTVGEISRDRGGR